ncbi:MAG: efflux RND transporter periplasmic adaptor subunit [Bernardetiaceae bacterium]|jgi:HlyD family secretion protein|nr:efflux RND transporter periplasmic adaptor subunit [Bernardetiaceae bacterium]
MATIDLQKKRKPKSNSRLYWWLGVGFLVLLGGAFGARKMGWIGGKDAVEVEFATVKRTEIVEKVSASGKVQPETEVKIAPLVSGEVIDVLVEEGDSVVRGQLLARIKPDNLKSVLDRVMANLNGQKANLAQARARMESAKATLLRRKLELDRTKTLNAQKAVSNSDLETAQTNYDVAVAELKSAEESIEAARFAVLSAEAQVKEASENLSFTSITAPMNGIITKRSVEKGERVVGTSQMSGTEMLRIADLRVMEVRVEVNENDIIRVATGDTAIVEVDSYTYQERKFKGVVMLLANSAKETANMSTDAITEFEVRIRILPESYRDLQQERQGKAPFRPGMTASVEIITDRKGGILTVPLAAVTTREEKKKTDGAGDQGGPPGSQPTTVSQNRPQNKADEKKKVEEVVFVNEGGKAKMIKVKTGISDYDNIEVLEGLKEGQQVVAGPFLTVSKTLKEDDLVAEAKAKKKDEKPN